MKQKSVGSLALLPQAVTRIVKRHSAPVYEHGLEHCTDRTRIVHTECANVGNVINLITLESWQLQCAFQSATVRIDDQYFACTSVSPDLGLPHASFGLCVQTTLHH